MRIHYAPVTAGEFPLDVCVVCEPGTFFPGLSVARIGSAQRPELEVEPIATWRDGSLALARVCGVMQHGDPATWMPLLLERGVAAPKAFRPDFEALWDALGFRLTITDAAGVAWVLEASGASANAVLEDVLSRKTGPKARREFSIIARPANLLAGGAHPRLEVELRWTIYSRHGGAQLEVSIENGRTDLPPQLVKIAGCRLELLGKDDGLPGPAVVTGAASIFPGKRAILTLPIGKGVGGCHVQPDVESWARLGIAPPFDTSSPIPELDGAKLQQSILRDKDRFPVGYGGVAPEGIPFHNFPLFPSMGATGDRYEIGDWPSWAVYAINGQGVTCRNLATAADLNGSAAFGVHWRALNAAGDGSSEWLGLPHFHKFLVKVAVPGDPAAKNPAEANVAHLPNLGAWTWLTKGRRAAADELACWALLAARDNYPNNGTLQNLGQRREAWALRQMALAACFLPDVHPQRDYLRGRLDATFAKWETAPLTHPLGSFGGTFSSSGRQTSVFTEYASAWMEAWFLAECMKAERLLGTNAGLDRVIQHGWEWWRGYAEAARGAPDWVAPSGEVIKFDADVLVDYSSPVSIYQPRWLKGWSKVPGSGTDCDTWAELNWWQRIQFDHSLTAPTAADVPFDPEPLHARPLLRDAKGNVVVPHQDGPFVPLNGSRFHEYGPGRVALHRWAPARPGIQMSSVLQDTVEVAAELERILDQHFAQKPAPAGVRTVEIKG